MSSRLPIMIREVWGRNLHEEFILIQQCLHKYRFISLDTEFPGTIYHPTNIPKHVFSQLYPSQLYPIMRDNANALKLIQLGLTLSDAHGNLPHFNTGFQYVWQFNFRDFDFDRDVQNRESTSLLERQGIDFLRNKSQGVDSRVFATLFRACGLVARGRNLTWITFQGLYDYGFMVKILTGRQLPYNFGEFFMLVHHYFGGSICDVKPISQWFGLLGGLDKIAMKLKLDRAAGKSHQAGSDSLLIMQVYTALMMMMMVGN